MVQCLKYQIAVDFENKKLYIRNNLLYAKDYGIYQDTPKTETSARTVPIPQETAELLQEYRQWWLLLRRESGSAWNMFIEISDGSGNAQRERADFLFIQEGEMLGYPMHPDSITSYLSRFSEREKLPHINPHAFRHTLASVLCLNGIDITTISKWLGHNNVTTTLNIYEHILDEGKEKVADCISDVILKKRA
ncbi:MAG: site-specific integrase [Ruminiclostridium sp.]|nr:site-specific integrase [Ruminiclostridium sp.]